MVGDHTSDTKGKHNETIGQRQTGQTSVCDPRHAGKPPTGYTAPPPPLQTTTYAQQNLSGPWAGWLERRCRCGSPPVGSGGADNHPADGSDPWAGSVGVADPLADGSSAVEVRRRPCLPAVWSAMALAPRKRIALGTSTVTSHLAIRSSPMI